jgi:hypothetical protein
MENSDAVNDNMAFRKPFDDRKTKLSFKTNCLSNVPKREI